MRSTFNALILQSLIFFVESTLILLAFKNTKKKRKGKVEGPVWIPSNILPINTGGGEENP